MASPEYLEALKVDLVQGFAKHLGIVPLRIVEGECHTRIDLEPRHIQQNGFVHAGVVTTLADHTAGYAAYSMVDRSHRILTIELKINFMSPADGEWIECLGRVLKPGRRVLVTEAEVFACRKAPAGPDHRSLVAKALLTMAAVPVEKVPPPKVARPPY